MAVTSTILVYCFLYMAIILIHCDGLTLTGIPTVYKGSRQKLTCYYGGFWGISDTTFYRDGEEFAEVKRVLWPNCNLKLLDNDLYDDFSKSCDWYRRTLIIKKVDDRYRYNNTVWQCESKGETSKNFTLKVKDLNPCNFNASISGNVSNIVEGDNLHLTCDANTTGDLNYSWTIYYNNGSTKTSTNTTIDKTASRGDTGMYSCQIKQNKHCLSETQIDIRVQYHPTVSNHSESSNSTINMTCIGDGYPDNFTFYGWHHFINDQLVRVLPGNETHGSSILTMERVTAIDNGKYVCLLSNGIPDKDGDLNASAESTIKLPATPLAIGVKTEEININIEDSVNMTSVFLTEDVISVTLIGPNDTHKELNVSDVVQEEYRDIKVYGTTVNVSVSVVQYSILNVTEEGHYYFNVCNVHELCNDCYGYRIQFTSKEPISGITDTEQPGQNLPIIVGTVAAVVVIMVIVIIVIVVVRRRSSTSKFDNYDQQGNSRTNPAFNDRNVEIIPNDTQIEIIPNDLYHASDPQDNKMEIIPNDLYVPSDPKPDTDFKNMEIIPNELYVSVDAETNNLNNATPDELYVGGETIARNKDIQKQIKSGYDDDKQVYMNDNMMHEEDA